MHTTLSAPVEVGPRHLERQAERLRQSGHWPKKQDFSADVLNARQDNPRSSLQAKGGNSG